MKFSFLRFLQWIGVAAVLLVLVGLKYDFASEASKTVNAPVENSLSQSMRGSWFLDDGSGTNATDASGNANTLAMTGSPSWVAGQIGPYSLDFSGSGQYLSVADPASGVLDFGDGADFTVSGWFNRDTFANDHTIVAKRNSSATNTDAGYIVWIDAAADKLNFTVGDGGGTASDQYTLASTSTFTAAGWHQFTAVWDDSLGMQLYIDGKLDNSTTSSTSSIGSLANALAFRIGAESDAGVPFDGKIDNITLYGRALSANEVFTLYQTAVPIQPVGTGLVGHWTFDGNDVDWGNASTEIKDVSGQGNHGDAVGLTTTSAVRGKLGQALSFNGTSDYINISSDIIGTGADSITAWIYQRSYTDFFAEVISNGKTSLFVGSSGNKQLLFSSDGLSTISTGDFDSIPLNQWVFIAGTRNSSGTTNLYVDGVLTGSANQSSGTPAGSLAGVTFCGDYSYYFDGIVDDVRIYNRVLSANEVMGLYNLGK